MHSLSDLIYLMARLREPQTGCPWDIKQDYASVVPHTIEETFEVVDAIDRGDMENLREELGDLLFQVIFYSRLAEEDQRFSFTEVVDGIVAKLLRRHPHVFPDGTLQSSRDPNHVLSDEEIRDNWNKIKRAEKPRATVRYLDSVSRSQPPTDRAYALQKKAAKVGFDWPNSIEVMAKVHEELAEVEEAVASANPDAIEDEIGDVLFSVINLARSVGADPNSALRRSNEKFYQRFSYIEETLKTQGISMADASLEQMESLWQAAKTKV